VRTWFSLAALAAALLAPPAAAQEDLVSGLSQDVVEITSNYTGTDLIVFGAIEHAQGATARDIVVVVRGPDNDMTVRRKDRIAGVWINDARARLYDMPSYYFVASTRALDKIASPDTLGLYDLGLDNLKPDAVLSDGPSEPYRQALLRTLARTGLYVQEPEAIEMLSPTLFRVRVPVPAAVPSGQYNVQVYLFRDGAVVSAQSTPLYVDQTGFERRLRTFALNSPLYYGAATVLMAVLLGWIASAAFRRFS
jgi:uncharacterized protein (TIGR02186 family)